MRKNIALLLKSLAELERAFGVTIPEAEVGYITIHLRSANRKYKTEYKAQEIELEISLANKAAHCFYFRQNQNGSHEKLLFI